MAKVFKVKITRTGMRDSRVNVWEGTIDELVNRVFGYTLECGNSWNRKINRNPRTIGALVKALNASYAEIEGGYTRSYAEAIN